jgi:5-hydroxyisourate hydrolase
MRAITTHVLDTSRGGPAPGVPVVLAVRGPSGDWKEIGRGVTDQDGRRRDLMAEGALAPGTYRLTFDTGAYFQAIGVAGFFPEATIVFTIRDASQHYHVPLLLSPFGYSTYRGS